MIQIDSRVGSRHLTAGLSALGVEFELAHLEYADCAFFGNGPNDSVVNIGIELKNVHDLINSMHSGRLAGHQIPGLLEHYAHVWLIVEGFYRARRQDGLVEVPAGGGWRPLHLGRRPVFWREIENFLTTLEVQANIHIRRTRTPNETCRFIHLLHGWWTDKQYDEHRSLQVLQVPSAGFALVNEDEATTRLRRVAACLPGIGWGRSKAVAEAFKSIEGLVEAGVSEWEAIDGIGAHIARDAVAAIREQTGSTSDSSTGRVSARRRVAPRSARHSRQRQNAGVDAGRAPRRGVRQDSAGH